MKLENEFKVNVPVERAWEVLTDIPEIAPCLPGAKLTGSEGDTHKGKVKIKVGPITAEYSGTADFIEKNEETRHVVIKAKGRDARGSGNASATITADMTPDGDGTIVSIDTDLMIAGKVAQFGKGVIGDVSKKLIDQFVDCIETKLSADSGSVADVASASASMTEGATGAAADAADSVTDGAGEAAAKAAAVAAGAGAAGAGAASAASSMTSAASDDDEMEALDLMDAAGGAVAKRLLPVAGAVVGAIILYFVLR